MKRLVATLWLSTFIFILKICMHTDMSSGKKAAPGFKSVVVFGSLCWVNMSLNQNIKLISYDPSLLHFWHGPTICQREKYLCCSASSKSCGTVYMRDTLKTSHKEATQPLSAAHTRLYLCAITAVELAPGSTKVKISYITQWLIDFSTPGRMPTTLNGREGGRQKEGSESSTLCST